MNQPLPGMVCTQFFSMPGGALGPNQTSTEPSALVLKPLSWLLTLGAFWSVIVYDNQTRSMVQTDQEAPSVSSQDKGVKTNADGSVDVWFGPKAPPGMEKNWVQTIPGKGWFMILRLYGPLEPWFNKTWRPGEIELQP